MIEWSPEKIKGFQKALLNWYDQNKRDLPWRVDHDPYHVWISEIMLQQTQVQTVIPYYQRFMKLFPTVGQLAQADESVLLKAWEGLGYYSRARHLQTAARQIVTDYGGQWPQTIDGLKSLSGVGPYTAGAIASIAFNQPVPAVDGNAFRVFSRLFKIDADIANPQTRHLFEKVIQNVISRDRPGDFNQAIMDLGASYMSAKNPDTVHSPVKQFDQAYLDGEEDKYPVKSKKKRPVRVNYFGLIIHSSKGFLFEQRPSDGILSHFLMFPLIKADELDSQKRSVQKIPSDEIIDTIFQNWVSIYQLQLINLALVDRQKVSHTFTHQKWQITLLEASLPSNSDLSYFPGKWVPQDQFSTIAFSKVQSKMWAAYQQKIPETN